MYIICTRNLPVIDRPSVSVVINSLFIDPCRFQESNWTCPHPKEAHPVPEHSQGGSIVVDTFTLVHSSTLSKTQNTSYLYTLALTYLVLINLWLILCDGKVEGNGCVQRARDEYMTLCHRL